MTPTLRRGSVVATVVALACALLAACDRDGGPAPQAGAPAARGGGQPAHPGRQALAPPGDGDVVVFIAKGQSRLFRLADTRFLPWGTVRFEDPTALVADPGQRCFYVLDRPRLKTGQHRLWRIAPDGSGQPFAAFATASNGGPFSTPVSLGLDETGCLLIGDREAGLWRVDRTGAPQQLFRGQEEDTPFFRITAATGGVAPNEILIATEYFTRLMTEDEMLARMPKTIQGGVFAVNTATRPFQTRQIVQNREAGGERHDTHWREPRQLLRDSASRLLLVDRGSEKTHETLPSGGKRPTRPHKLTTEIRGGVLVRHPGGRVEDLTFKTPDRGSGGLRNPRGIAEWARDAYIVADPELHVDGMSGSGGLMLLRLDGTREARWRFGYRIKPFGVAILRGVGNLPLPPALPITMQDLAGTHQAGQIAQIGMVSLQRKAASPYGPGHPLHGLPPITSAGNPWREQPRPQAIARFRALLEGAQWQFGPDGSFRFTARPDPAIPAALRTLTGKATANGQMAFADARYRATGNFDFKVGSLDAMMTRPRPGELTLSVVIHVFSDSERLKAEFEQPLALRRGQ